MDNAHEGFDSLDLQKTFENLPDDKKVEFLKDLQDVTAASDQYLAEIEGIIKDTIDEFGGTRSRQA